MYAGFVKSLNIDEKIVEILELDKEKGWKCGFGKIEQYRLERDKKTIVNAWKDRNYSRFFYIFLDKF
jgi:hypothetical protein